ncbi:MAG TPA: hypothetical protein VKY22_09575 [Bradyrhizobium sp.]|nr:hypothetical protein [Bradyrhizobium sp.]
MTRLGIGSTIDPQTGSRVPLALLVAALMAFGLYGVLVAGPAMRADAQAALDRTLADETSAFCEKFGMRAGTSEFVSCSQELTTIRKRQTDRDSEAGML